MAEAPYSIRIKSPVRERLERESAKENRPASHFINEALEEYFSARDYKAECIRAAILEADKGVFISEKAMMTWMKSIGTANELPPPEPDVFLKKS
jgi:predicted transcriptional regulator